MDEPRHNGRGLIVVAVLAAVAMTSTAALLLRELDLNRIESRQVEANTRVINDVRRTTRVLCNRGYILIDLINGALILIGQRLEADIRAGDNAAVKADRRFLVAFLEDREKLTQELTGRGPCAPP
jgi:hypothetical protein